MGKPSVVVAGGGGFIGGHLVGALLEAGHRVRSVDCKPQEAWQQRHAEAENVVADLRQRAACQAACEDMDHCYQLAADMGGMGFIERNKAACMLSVLVSTHMLLAAKEGGVSAFFYASSACVYNAAKQAREDVSPLREADAYPADPEDGYGWEKLFSERMCRHFQEDFGLPARVARYHNVYGPFGTWEGGREKAPAAICRKVIEAKHSGVHDIEIWGDGHQTRSFMHIDDCVHGTLGVMRQGSATPVNLGSSELVTINGLVDIVEDIAGIRLARRYDLDAPKGVNGRNSDNTRLRALLGWEPTIALRDGMERTYRWIHDQYMGKYG